MMDFFYTPKSLVCVCVCVYTIYKFVCADTDIIICITASLLLLYEMKNFEINPVLLISKGRIPGLSELV